MELSTLTHADLVGRLLSPAAAGGARNSSTLRDNEPVYGAAVIGDATLAYKLSVARELLLRDLNAQMIAGPVMNSPQVLRDWLRLYFAGMEHEVFLVMFLRSNNALIEAVELFRGTLTQTAVYPREVVKSALARNAAAIIMAHNHPSGHAEPSRADEYLTQTLKSALSLVDVRVLDHFVVAGDQAASMAERGLL